MNDTRTAIRSLRTACSNTFFFNKTRELISVYPSLPLLVSLVAEALAFDAVQHLSQVVGNRSLSLTHLSRSAESIRNHIASLRISFAALQEAFALLSLRKHLNKYR